jgi:hypothetical protein
MFFLFSQNNFVAKKENGIKKSDKAKANQLWNRWTKIRPESISISNHILSDCNIHLRNNSQKECYFLNPIVYNHWLCLFSGRTANATLCQKRKIYTQGQNVEPH